MNLSDTDSPVRSIASHSTDVSDSSREHVFDLSGWFEVNTNSHKFISRVMHRPAGRLKGGPQLSQRAAAARKAATDSGGGSSSSSSSSNGNSKISSNSNSNGKKESLTVSKASESTAAAKSAVAASTATPREGCKNPQLNIQIIISRSFVH